ncbi:hypothetical protein BM613_00890 [Sulfoacidibacillus thermotolerans]|uniref:Uncharacterized protein n=1 Tax=Sulfoacidibacillus thermotolerans TaxID=1765684 RepID=A0A2U3DBN1_SULT2|nr:hypothetical protein BM613_00890 [Sulfoacidibacillus thermotolerans]
MRMEKGDVVNMMQLWLFSLMLCVGGLWFKESAVVTVGFGLFTISWFALMDEVQGSPFITWLTLYIKKWPIQWRIHRLLVENEEILLLCQRFARKYPRYLYIPFQLGEFDEVNLTRLLRSSTLSLKREEIPAPWQDLAIVAKRHLGKTIDIFVLVLLANREVHRYYQNRIEKEVIQGKRLQTAEDFSAVCLRFSIWERECEKQDGGPTLFYRELFAELLAKAWSVQEMRRFVKAGRFLSMHAVVNQAVQEAHEAVLSNRRAILLESHLVQPMQSQTEFASEAWTVTSSVVTVETLQHLAKNDVSACVRWLQEIFLSAKNSLAYRAQAEKDGYFVASSGDQRILFQVGFVSDSGRVEEGVVDHVYAHMALEQADRAIVLALGRVDAQFLQCADQFNILVLPSDELDRLLAAYSERMWHIVDWSLRTSMRVHEKAEHQEENESCEENSSEGLELGLST